MEYATMRSTTMRMLLAGFVLVMVMFAVFASNASAQEVVFEGRELPGKTWTCGHCVEQNALAVVGACANTTSSVCAGAVVYNGSWSAPYGWLCGGHDVQYSFPAIKAFAAVDNPNPGAFKGYGFTAFG